MVIDSHIHRYPPEVIAYPKGWGRQVKEHHWLKLVTGEEGGNSIQDWADREKLLGDMDAAGVDRAVMLGWYWENQQTCELQNAWHLDWLREDGDRFIGFAAVQPLAGVRAFDGLRRAIDSGLLGIGEIHPAAQGFAMDHPTWIKILDWAQESNIPVTMHATEPAGHGYPGKVSTPLEDFLWVARRFPELTIILAHWGGGLPFYELNPECRKTLKHVFYDTAASPLIYDGRIFRSVVDIIGAEKVIFGSDYPLMLYPREVREPGLGRFVAETRSSGLDDAQLECVLGGNMARVLGI